MAAAERSNKPGLHSQAVSSLVTLIQMCEGSVLKNMPGFENQVRKTRAAINAYRQQAELEAKTMRGLTTLTARFATQADVLIAYYDRHFTRSQSTASDDLNFLEGFRSLQLKVLEESQTLQEFLSDIAK